MPGVSRHYRVVVKSFASGQCGPRPVQKLEPTLTVLQNVPIIGMWRCDGSLVALQTIETVVSGSDPVSLTVKNSEDRQSHHLYCKMAGQRENLPLRQKKKFKWINSCGIIANGFHIFGQKLFSSYSKH